MTKDYSNEIPGSVKIYSVADAQAIFDAFGVEELRQPHVAAFLRGENDLQWYEGLIIRPENFESDVEIPVLIEGVYAFHRRLSHAEKLYPSNPGNLPGFLPSSQETEKDLSEGLLEPLTKNKRTTDSYLILSELSLKSEGKRGENPSPKRGREVMTTFSVYQEFQLPGRILVASGLDQILKTKF